MRDRVLEFLNTGTKKDLYEVPSMTEKKIDTIVSNRPFSSWADLVSRELVRGPQSDRLEFF